MDRSADDTLSLPLGSKPGLRAVPESTPAKWTLSSIGPLLVLLLITLIGGYFRFYRLAYPPLWNDESLVYWRVCGTYGQMLEPLRHDMFPPLHYSLYWLIGHYHKLTPITMRMVPAVAGTLTIPAIYFLARQLLSRGTSLLAAAFTACSAFMLFYSRDAKMYPHLYLLVTLNVACLLWWFRTSKSTAWLCWVAAGSAACGLHASALTMPAISFLFFFTQQRVRWQQFLWFLLGTILILAGPIGYFTKFNPAVERLENQGWDTTGIGWVGGFFNGNRTGPQHAQYTAAAFLTGYEWPRDDYLPPDADQPISPALLDPPMTATTEVFWILAVGLLPWPLFLRPARDPDTAAQWRVFLWLGGWILVIGYGFYCHSVDGFVSPRRWDYELLQWLGEPGIAVVIACVTIFIPIAATNRQYRPALLRFVQLTGVIAVLYALCLGIFHIMYEMAVQDQFTEKIVESIWTPRYLGFMWPAVGITAAALLMRLPTRPVRIACITFVLAVNLVMAGLRMTINTEAPVDRLAHDLWLSQDEKSDLRTFYFIVRSDIAFAGSGLQANPRVASGRYYLEMESNHQPMSPTLFEKSLDWYNLRSNNSYSAVKRSVESSPQLKRVVFWTQLAPRQPLAFDPYQKVLKGWKLKTEDVYTIHIYWDWRERWKWVRREYVRRNAE